MDIDTNLKNDPNTTFHAQNAVNLTEHQDNSAILRKLLKEKADAVSLAKSNGK